MTWLRVDDKFHSHRKARKAVRSHTTKRRDAAALGLWTAAASWSADNLTDGFVPADELEAWDDDHEAIAQRLVDAGLWYADEVDGEPGFRFHDWAAYNPDARSVMLRREAESEGGKRGNHVRWHVGQKIKDPECSYCTDPSNGSGTRSGTRSGRSRGSRVGGESSRPGPARPAAAAATEDAAAAADDALPGPLAILRSKLQAHTPLRGLRFDALTPDQADRLTALVALHGDEALVRVAVDTCRNPAPTYVAAFLGTWEALPAPGQVLHVVRPSDRTCPTHSLTLSPAGICNACAIDARVGDR
ncbi:hypothetical protein QWY28_17245 [Nocardioides sp. SOB77]|uniref:Uncharacterized protein n=1 Tax=Nocardioides oceani TaxID=3058369 RepID=A0ABT8FJP0_9ACTN|nr:hypothetical protein [Nocardioides oceani]MDN4174710.1 hypothetical protein [Nocardioides oceani]